MRGMYYFDGECGGFLNVIWGVLINIGPLYDEDIGDLRSINAI